MADAPAEIVRKATPEEAARYLGMAAGTWPHPPGYPRKPLPDELTQDMPIVPRSEWGALPPRHVDHVEVAEVPHVILNHTRSRTCSDPESCVKKMQYLQKKHLDKGLPDIKYNFVIGGDGRVYEGRGWTVCPHVNNQWPEVTKKCVEFAYIGNYGRFHRPKRPGRKLVGPMWELIEVGYSKDYIAFDPVIHQRRYWPKVQNCVNVNPCFGVDWVKPEPHV